eukprot:TRINITY_DN2574_c0_g1_i1.p1 TRINITY_DN2574_c0_g1~~TRINITY_DN2574_c0_g1_i1.p1  ORF type:complete len:172 (+),score=26.44 TRINITY_DN2574_c0_g1_i1:269-784(+)
MLEKQEEATDRVRKLLEELQTLEQATRRAHYAQASSAWETLSQTILDLMDDLPTSWTPPQTPQHPPSPPPSPPPAQPAPIAFTKDFLPEPKHFVTYVTPAPAPIIFKSAYVGSMVVHDPYSFAGTLVHPCVVPPFLTPTPPSLVKPPKSATRPLWTMRLIRRLGMDGEETL